MLYNFTDSQEQYFQELGKYLEVITSEVNKSKIGKNEEALIKAATEFVNESNDPDKLFAIEDALLNLQALEKKGKVHSFASLARAAKKNDDELTDSVYSHNYSTLVPQIIAGDFIPTQEWEYIGSKIMPTKRLESNNTTIQLYATTPLTANWTSEGAQGAQKIVDVMSFRQLQARVKPYDIVLSFTYEALKDAMWPILDVHLSEAQRAMNRFKEEQIWDNFDRFGHLVFNPDLGTTAFATTGVDGNYDANNTMSVYDFLDLVATLYMHGFTPTDILMHPLHYLTFVKTAMRGGLFLPEANKAAIASSFKAGSLPHHEGSPADSFISEQLGGLIPNVWTTKFCKFDVRNMKASMYAIDRQQVGMVLVRDGMRRMEWEDPSRDQRYIRFKDEMGVSIFHEGRAIALAKNIAVDTGYNMDITFIYDIASKT